MPGAERQRSVKFTFSLNEDRRFVKEGDVMMTKDKSIAKPFSPSRSEGIVVVPTAVLLHATGMSLASHLSSS
jgi:hypothetical protein